MNNLSFDITRTPPDMEALAKHRREASGVLAAVAKRERWFPLACYGVGAIGLATLPALWLLGVIPLTDALEGAILLAGMIVLMITVYAAFLGFVNAVGGAFPAAFPFASAFASTSASAFASVSALEGAFPGTVVGAFAGTVVGTLVGTVAGGTIIQNYIDAPRRLGNDAMAMLVELEASDMGDECIEYMGMVDSDETIRSYQHQLRSIGRKPIRGEYRAAKAWIEGKAARLRDTERMERAKIACDRMEVAS